MRLTAVFLIPPCCHVVTEALGFITVATLRMWVWNAGYLVRWKVFICTSIHSYDHVLKFQFVVVNGDLRLVNQFSTSSRSGRLEIYLQGEWGTVCGDGFGTAEGDVACRQLGYHSTSRVSNVDELV